MIIADFGLATPEAELKKQDVINLCGTYAYMAPETLLRIPHGFQTAIDMWSLGCIFYELLTLRQLVDKALT